METQKHRHSLYKEHKEALNPSEHNRINRQLQETNRQKKRIDLYQSSRKISPSPTPDKAATDRENDNNENGGGKGTATDKENDNKENSRVNRTVNTASTIENKSRTAKLICTARDPEKIRKQEAFILRFLDWKDKKKAMLEKQKCGATKKRPFVPVVRTNSGFGGKSVVESKATVTAAGATDTHHHPLFVLEGRDEFIPPPGLKFPEGMLRKEKIRSRQSIYTVVPTPPKKLKPSSEFPIARKVFPTNMLGQHLNSHKKKAPVRTATNNQTKPVMSGGAKMTAPAAAASTPSTKSNVNSATKPPTTKPVNNLVKVFDNVKSTSKNNPTTTTTNIATRSTYKQRSLKIPPPPTVPARRPPPSSRIRKPDIAAPKTNFNGARIKATASSKRVENTKRATGKKSPTQPHKNASLTKTMKAKKPTKAASRQTATKIVSLMMNQVNDNHMDDMLVQTPRDFSNTNQFEEFVTSTKVKNSSQTLEEVKGVSPIELLTTRSSSSAKRNILNKTATNKESSNIDVEKKLQGTSNSRFNFVRYSEINTTINDEYDDEEAIKNIQVAREMAQEKVLVSEIDENLTLLADNSLQDQITPTKPKLGDDDKPVNYLSPFVSVSRGKVSLKKEKEKRNSIYLASPAVGCGKPLNVSQHNASTKVASPTSPEYSVEVRRTLEAVRYYRNQLQDEIDRLHKKCDFWEAYKGENKDILQAANVDDMIDVAVGQTRLLTSKKFMQFKGLIDRCEAGATGIGNRSYDGSEATRFISSTDLEGFWSMLGLQIDNLEQRFVNLNRWKDNSWQDPDEAKPKATKPKNLSKIKKKTTAPAAKAKPNSALQQMLRKMQAEMRIKKANNMLATIDDVFLTPSKVRDRKYFSPAATVIGLPTSSANRRLSLVGRKNSQDTPNRRTSIGGGGVNGRRNSHESPKRLTPSATTQTNSEKTPATMTRRATLHESVMRANSEALAGFCSPKMQSRKSILKTPGSARTNLRNVVFNHKCRVKKFNFILNDGGEDGVADVAEYNESMEEDMKQNPQGSDQESENGLMSACGTYSLRNRKVRLRPSSEFVIPK